MRATRVQGLLFWCGVLLVALGVSALMSASAQDAQFTFDPVGWGSNPALALLATAGLVAWLRQTQMGAWLDGPIRVGTATLVVGVGIGTVVSVMGTLTVEPFSLMPGIRGGVLYGLGLAFSVVTGVSFFNYLGSKVRPVTLHVGEGVALAATGAGAGDFIMWLVRNMVPAVKLPEALKAVAPLIAQFAQSEVVLTDELRSDLQAKVLSALRRAGLVGVDL